LIRAILFFLLPVPCLRISESDGRTSGTADPGLNVLRAGQPSKGAPRGSAAFTRHGSWLGIRPIEAGLKECPMPGPGRFKVVVADFLDETSVESPVLKEIAELVLCRATREEELADALPEADAIILFHDIPQLSEVSFARATRCKCVVRAGVGYNNVDLQAATRHGVVVCNVPDYGTEEVADHAIMFLLALTRRLIPCHEAIRGGNWHYQSAVGTPRLRGKTLGLIGCGRIGTATAVRAKSIGLDVVFYDPHLRQGMDKALGIRRSHTLEDLLEQSHFISLHCYLDETTHHLINARTIARMRAGVVLINTARGPCIDEEALLTGLESGRIAAAGLDVVEREPLDREPLRQHPRVLLTPHSAFYSVEGFIELRTKTAEEVRRILLGQAPRNPVNMSPPRLYTVSSSPPSSNPSPMEDAWPGE
jgi:phosphoglycerate dehydrogenase-like enzyme